MSHAADPSHPRYASLLKRGLLEVGARKGMLADSALIAHGRGEAFDYLLGERSHSFALDATHHATRCLFHAHRPVISVNGNTVALASDQLLLLAARINAPIEINIFYRTQERMRALFTHLQERKDALTSHEASQDRTSGIGASVSVADVPILGMTPDDRIPGLEGPRAACCSTGIGGSDVLLVPLEDGDRCEALVAMGKTVIVIDLNPWSRSARSASVTIVDELTRVADNMLGILGDEDPPPPGAWRNESNLHASIDAIRTGFGHMGESAEDG